MAARTVERTLVTNQPLWVTLEIMNDDDPRQVMEMLKAEHRRLDEEITALLLAGTIDQLEIARLKKRKLLLKDEIQQLNDRIIPDIIA
jgi:hypothetical protein